MQKGSDQTQLSWDDIFKRPRTCGIDRVSNQISKEHFGIIVLLVFNARQTLGQDFYQTYARITGNQGFALNTET